MTDVLSEPAVAAALDQTLTDQLGQWCRSGDDIRMAPASWQPIIAVGRGVWRGIVQMATLEALVLDAFGDSVDPTQIASQGPFVPTFGVVVGSGQGWWATFTADAVLPRGCYRWLLSGPGTQGIQVVVMDGALDDRTVTLTLPAKPFVVGRVVLEITVAGQVQRSSRIVPLPSHTPILASLSQDSVEAHGAPFTLHVYGGGFGATPVIVWNGGDEPTVAVSDTECTTGVDPGTVSGPFGVNVQVRADGNLSNALRFSFVNVGQADLPNTIR